MMRRTRAAEREDPVISSHLACQYQSSAVRIGAVRV
jgi:hypothetical protein